MISFFRQAYANFRGDDAPERIVTAMDGPLCPNTLLDEAPVLLEHDGIDNLCATDHGIFASSGNDLLELALAEGKLSVRVLETLPRAITCLATSGTGALALGQDGEGILIRRGEHDGAIISEAGEARFLCPTACVFIDDHTLLIANGSAEHHVTDWKRDLMKQCRSGSIWRIGLSHGGESTCLAHDLAFPCGLALDRGGKLFASEAWAHRVVSLDVAVPSEPYEVLGELPAYPGAIAPASDGSFWLALFAPRNPLVEFVISERRYCERMIDTIDPEFWIAPALSSGKSFLEPIQGGARKKLNVLKPWSPSWSYGLALQCDKQFRAHASIHSRADGKVHGVTSFAEKDGRLLVGARGSDLVVSVPVDAQIGIGVDT